jgi:CubicO group peptidase (beta-lactamase class C family)
VLDSVGDWYEMILSTPMMEHPGTRMNCSNAAPVLTTGIAQKASGMEIDSFAKRYLLDPL